MTSKTTVLAVVITIGVLTAIALSGTIYLADQHVDAGVIATVGGFAGVGLGALAALLSSTRSTLGSNDAEPTALVPASSRLAAGGSSLAGVSVPLGQAATLHQDGSVTVHPPAPGSAGFVAGAAGLASAPHELAPQSVDPEQHSV